MIPHDIQIDSIAGYMIPIGSDIEEHIGLLFAYVETLLLDSDIGIVVSRIAPYLCVYPYIVISEHRADEVHPLAL